jgi:hypothetical protein
MNARMYDPAVGRFLSPDPFVQAPDFSQSFNRYSYGLNNPLKYTDPSGEAWWHWALGIADVFSGGAISFTALLTAQATSVPFVAASSNIPFLLSNPISSASAILSTTQAISHIYMGSSLFLDGMADLGGSVFRSDGSLWAGRRFDNRLKLFGGLFQGSFGDVLSRFTWENIQTSAGLGWSLNRNTMGDVDRVDYFDGATFITNENDPNSISGSGISLGNYININIPDKITGDFENWVTTHPLYMHEYGHYLDSKNWGLSYLLAIGVPSLNSANNSVWQSSKSYSTHDEFWTETRANRNAKKYFGRYYGVNWNYIDYPLK